MITLHLAKQLRKKGLDATPGCQLCRNCFQKATTEEQSIEPAEAGNEIDFDATEIEQEVSRDAARDAARDLMYTSFEELAVSPIKKSMKQNVK